MFCGGVSRGRERAAASRGIPQATYPPSHPIPPDFISRGSHRCSPQRGLGDLGPLFPAHPDHLLLFSSSPFFQLFQIRVLPDVIHEFVGRSQQRGSPLKSAQPWFRPPEWPCWSAPGLRKRRARSKGPRAARGRCGPVERRVRGLERGAVRDDHTQQGNQGCAQARSEAPHRATPDRRRPGCAKTRRSERGRCGSPASPLPPVLTSESSLEGAKFDIWLIYGQSVRYTGRYVNASIWRV